jgi:hypothetical protein
MIWLREYFAVNMVLFWCVREWSRLEFTEHISGISSYIVLSDFSHDTAIFCPSPVRILCFSCRCHHVHSSGYSQFLAGSLEPKILDDDNPRVLQIQFLNSY